MQTKERLSQVELGSGNEVLLDNTKCTAHQALLASALQFDASAIPNVARYIGHLHLVKGGPGEPGAIVVASTPPICPIPRPLLSSMYIVKGVVSGEELPCAGKVVHPQWIDSSLPGLWRATCDRLHTGLCKQLPDAITRSISPALVVDVIRQCITISPDNCSYVALSYVWGSQVTLHSMKANISKLQQIGSLSTERLSVPIAKTIRDAMGITALLDERYLWVDSLCIVQDDEVQKGRELDHMAAIYSNASVTIVAAQGEHANSGLHGFRGISDPRTCSQTVHYLKDKSIVIQHAIDGDSMEVESSNSKWKTRAWTYQERIFSRRRLVFEGDYIRWSCAAEVWREHIAFNPVGYSQNPRLDDSIFKQTIPDLSTLESLLVDFNSRNLTYPEDALRAFAGISWSLSTSFAGGFLSGLPISLLDAALLWQPREQVFRRIPKDPEKHFELPSWSWAGWSGEIEFDSASASDFIRANADRTNKARERRIVRILLWKFHKTLQSPGEPIHPVILNSKDMFLAGRIDNLPGWSKHDAFEHPTPFYEPPDPRSSTPSFFYRHEAHPGHEFWYPFPLQQAKPTSNIIAPFISCRSRRGWYHLSEEINKQNGYRPVFSLRDSKGAWAGTLQPHDGLNIAGDGLQDAQLLLELVEIAQGFCRDRTSPWPGIEEVRHPERPSTGMWYEYYWVMWVKWIDGVAYRRGLGRVYKAIWEQNRGKYFNLMLG